MKLSNITKKFLVILVSSFYLLTSSFMPFAVAKAADDAPSTWYNQSFENWFVKVYDDDTSPPSEIFGERYTAAQVQWIVYSLVSLPFVAGSDLSKQAITCAMSKDLIECADAVGKFIESILQTNNPNKNESVAEVVFSNPVSGIRYTKNMINKFRFVPEAKAQGFGYDNANLSLYLWKITRNFSYSLIVLAVIIMAFMIMFRVKISPQIVISVQSALPKIIITIILITFSYAIAGFLIDLIYVLIGLFSSLIIQGGLTTFDFPTLFKSLTSGKNVFTLLLQYWLLFVVGAMGHIFSGAVVGGVLMIIFAIFSILLLLFYCVKIIFMFLKTFVNITLLIAFAPLQILMGAFVPNAGFGPWLKAMVSNLLVYPIAGVLFFLAFLFLRQVFPDDAFWDSAFVFNVTNVLGAQTWDPPLTVGTGTGAFDGIWILLLALSFTLIGLISKTKDLIDMTMAGKGFSGIAVGEPMALSKAGGMYVASKMAQDQTPVWLGNLINKLPDRIRPSPQTLKAVGETGQTVFKNM